MPNTHSHQGPSTAYDSLDVSTAPEGPASAGPPPIDDGPMAPSVMESWDASPAPVPPVDSAPRPRPAGCAIPGCGLAAVFVAVFAYLGAMLVGAVGGAEGVALAVVGGSLAVLTGGVGLVLVGNAQHLGRVEPPRAFGPVHPLAWLALLLGVLTFGSAVLGIGSPLVTAVVFPPVHVLASLAPALTIIAYVAWRARRPGWLTWRRVTRQLVWGGLVASMGALVLEGLVGIALVVGVGVVLQATAGGQALLTRASDVVSLCGGVAPGAACETQLMDLLREFARSPVVAAAVFSLLAIFAPLIEETLKVTGVVRARPRDRGEAWALGVSTGAGFGILEATMIGALTLTPGAWAVAVLVRATATLLHTTMTGLAGLGWFAATTGRRLTGLVSFGAAVAGHALWNALVFAAVYAAFVGDALGSTTTTTGATGAAALATFGVFTLFTIIFAAFGRLSEWTARSGDVAS
jgi:hypothetical protein